jgi:GH43 family beta-xylosidase
MRSTEPTSEKSMNDPGLVFPWGRISIDATLASSRARAYLRWAQRQPTLRRLAMVDRLLGLRRYQTKQQYERVKAWT